MKNAVSAEVSSAIQENSKNNLKEIRDYFTDQINHILDWIYNRIELLALELIKNRQSRKKETLIIWPNNEVTRVSNSLQVTIKVEPRQ